MSSRRGGWRVALRLARREALRRKGQSVLMLFLICLPVVAVTAAAVVWRTQDVSSVESIERRMGAAAALVQDSGTREVFQQADPDVFVTYAEGPGVSEPRTVDDVRAVLGADRPVVPLLRESGEYETDAGRAETELLATDLASPLTTGLLERVRGTFPPGPGEVVVNQALADRGPGVGDELTLLRRTAEGQVERTVRIVGIAESTQGRGVPLAAGLPETLGVAVSGGGTLGSWLVGGGPVDWSDVRALNAAGLSAASRAVITDPPADSAVPPEARDTGGGTDEVALTALGTVIAMVLLEVVLLAGPAFAVRAKAQAHTLALVAATGGTPRQARRTVLASGVVVGLVGGLLGLVLGIGVGALGVPVAQSFNGTRFGPFDVPWPLLALVALFGFLSAVLAATVPAFSASRQDVVAVLAGRRGEGRPSGRTPLLGVVLLGVGITAAAIGSRPGGAAPVLVAGSAIISVVGMILFVPVAVTLAARLAGRLPLPLRFATRDAARHRTRTVPAVAAVGATVAGVIALSVALASQEAANQRSYDPQLPSGYGSVILSSEADRGAIDAVLAASLPADRPVEIRGVETSTDDGGTDLEFRQGGDVLQLSYWSSLGSPYLVASAVPDYVAVTDAERARADAVLAAGGLVLFSDPRAEEDAGVTGPSLDGDRVTVDALRWKAADLEGTPRTIGSATVKGVVTPVLRTSPVMVALAPALAERLHVRTVPTGLLLPAPIGDEAEKDIAEGLAALPAPPYFYVERGYRTGSDVKIIRAVLVALGLVLMLGGTLTATFLALSDARPDLATLAAVGARPRTRRRIASSYAAVVGLIGALLGTPVGFIPGIAVSRPLAQDPATGTSVIDVPWLVVLVVVVGLPVLTALVVGACARGRLPMTARID